MRQRTSAVDRSETYDAEDAKSSDDELSDADGAIIHDDCRDETWPEPVNMKCLITQACLFLCCIGAIAFCIALGFLETGKYTGAEYAKLEILRDSPESGTAYDNLLMGSVQSYMNFSDPPPVPGNREDYERIMGRHIADSLSISTPRVKIVDIGNATSGGTRLTVQMYSNVSNASEVSAEVAYSQLVTQSQDPSSAFRTGTMGATYVAGSLSQLCASDVLAVNCP